MLNMCKGILILVLFMLLILYYLYIKKPLSGYSVVLKCLNK